MSANVVVATRIAISFVTNNTHIAWILRVRQFFSMGKPRAPVDLDIVSKSQVIPIDISFSKYPITSSACVIWILNIYQFDFFTMHIIKMLPKPESFDVSYITSIATHVWIWQGS